MVEDFPNSIPVTVDKSHITTLGERLYTESIELIRELVNNAYDADATTVKVTVQNDCVKVEDNGTGMDWGGLLQYFNIGSPEKVEHSKSPILRRDRIGQFGIGKFASLAACRRFEVYTQKKAFAARVIFDKREWAESGETWELPVEILEADRSRKDGTTVILSNLTRTFNPDLVRQKILESVPIQAKDFVVTVNGKRVVLSRVPGHRIPFLEGTQFGPVHGEIVITPASQGSANEMGIQVRVKGVMIKREYFGIHTLGREGTRVRGEVNADFLPVTSDRSGFRTDTEEYRSFSNTMDRVMQDVRKELGRLSDKKETQKVKQALKEAIDRIQQALGTHPDFIDTGVLPLGQESDAIGEAGDISNHGEKDKTEQPLGDDEALIGDPQEQNVISENHEDYETKPTKGKQPKVKRLTPNAVVRKISLGDHLVSCCLDYFGEDGPECFTQGQIIYINRDHPLYKRESKKKITHTMYLARLLSQEIALMKSTSDPRVAFQRQSELLRDAFSN